MRKYEGSKSSKYFMALRKKNLANWKRAVKEIVYQISNAN